jgi:AbrB family transcriptional regulator (stage V sporulation protein T)
MKATGIVRRIDDLGRVVIPKEIRRTMRIREGDPLEIFTDREGEVIFKKYSPIGEMSAFAAQYAETLHKTCGMAVVICDRDAVIAAAGIPKKEYNDRKLSPALEHVMESRTLYTAQGQDEVPVIEGNAYLVRCAMPIITEGDVTGCVASVYNRDADGAQTMNGDLETKLIQTAAGFLGRQLEA